MCTESAKRESEGQQRARAYSGMGLRRHVTELRERQAPGSRTDRRASA